MNEIVGKEKKSLYNVINKVERKHFFVPKRLALVAAPFLKDDLYYAVVDYYINERSDKLLREFKKL